MPVETRGDPFWESLSEYGGVCECVRRRCLVHTYVCTTDERDLTRRVVGGTESGLIEDTDQSKVEAQYKDPLRTRGGPDLTINVPDLTP